MALATFEVINHSQSPVDRGRLGTVADLVAAGGTARRSKFSRWLNNR